MRLMVDAIGLWLASSPSLHELRARRRADRRLQSDRLAAAGKFRAICAIIASWVIADDRWLWAGGRNLAVEYFEGNDAVGRHPWIDLSFDLRGATAAAPRGSFSSTGARRILIRAMRSPRAPVARGERASRSSCRAAPIRRKTPCTRCMLAACFRAEKRLLAVTPYFVPDHALLMAMRLAAQRGVEVTLVLPWKSNHRLADFVRGRALRALAQAGGRIRLVPRMVHAKAVIVDDSLAWCGSVNLDSRSLLINYESVVVFRGFSRRSAGWREWVGALARRRRAVRPAPGGAGPGRRGGPAAGGRVPGVGAFASASRRIAGELEGIRCRLGAEWLNKRCHNE